jgi:hypothetical protein
MEMARKTCAKRVLSRGDSATEKDQCFDLLVTRRVPVGSNVYVVRGLGSVEIRDKGHFECVLGCVSFSGKG